MPLVASAFKPARMARLRPARKTGLVSSDVLRHAWFHFRKLMLNVFDKFRIHGDNIVECDRCLELIAHAFGAQVRLLPSEPYRPAFEIFKDSNVLFAVDLIPGHGRWHTNLQQMFREHGAPLREATDVVLTKLSGDGKTELIVAALEFCSALPAGNNAWQVPSSKNVSTFFILGWFCMVPHALEECALRARRPRHRRIPRQPCPR
jgi:hypothetical protein